LAGNLGAVKDLIFLIPGGRRFKTAGGNLSVEYFVWDANGSVLTEPAASPMSDSAESSDGRPLVYPTLEEDFRLFDNNNGLWISPPDKPVLMRLPRESLHAAFNQAAPGGSETYDVTPFRNAMRVDREGNIWFGDPQGIHRFFYTPLIRQEFPREPTADFAVVAEDNGAVWLSSGSSCGKVERRVPQVTSAFAYRAPDKTFCISGYRCLWHLVGHDFVRVNLPPGNGDGDFSARRRATHRNGNPV
jgi:hypothetical protein